MSVSIYINEGKCKDFTEDCGLWLAIEAKVNDYPTHRKGCALDNHVQKMISKETSVHTQYYFTFALYLFEAQHFILHFFPSPQHVQYC